MNVSSSLEAVAESLGAHSEAQASLLGFDSGEFAANKSEAEKNDNEHDLTHCKWYLSNKSQ